MYGLYNKAGWMPKFKKLPMNPYTNTETIQRLLESMNAKGLDKKVYSDIIDEDGNQYVDLVQEGGAAAKPLVASQDRSLYF